MALTVASRQSGLATIAANGTSTTAAITSVDLTKTILFLTVDGVSQSPDEFTVEGVFSSATQLSFERGQADADAATNIEWTVVEFSDADLSVQAFTVAAPSSTSTTSITAVTLARSFIVSSGSQGPSGSQWDPDQFIELGFDSTTSVRVQVEDVSDTGPSTSGFVVELPSGEGSVQSVAFTASNQTVAITSVDLSKSFLIGTHSMTGGSKGGNDALFCSFASATSAEIENFSGESNMGSSEFYAVELTNGSVDSGLLVMSGTTASVAHGRDRDFSCAYWQSNNTPGFSGANISADRADRMMASADLQASTTEFTRGGGGGNPNFNWFVIEWGAAASAGITWTDAALTDADTLPSESWAGSGSASWTDAALVDGDTVPTEIWAGSGAASWTDASLDDADTLPGETWTAGGATWTDGALDDPDTLPGEAWEATGTASWADGALADADALPGETWSAGGVFWTDSALVDADTVPGEAWAATGEAPWADGTLEDADTLPGETWALGGGVWADAALDDPDTLPAEAWSGTGSASWVDAALDDADQLPGETWSGGQVPVSFNAVAMELRTGGELEGTLRSGGEIDGVLRTGGLVHGRAVV